MAYINNISEEKLKKHLGVFLKNIPLHIDELDIPHNELEHLNKQFLALSWILDMKKKLKIYSIQMGQMLAQLDAENTALVSTTFFLDLPRPPVFLFHTDIRHTFHKVILKVKRAPSYSPAIGKELGILNFNNELTEVEQE